MILLARELLIRLIASVKHFISKFLQTRCLYYSWGPGNDMQDPILFSTFLLESRVHLRVLKEKSWEEVKELM